jgi:hypothetical protein
MESFKALFENGPAIIKAASESGLGIVALSCLVLGAAGVIYLSRIQHSAPWIGFGVFVFLVLGAVGLSVVGLYVGAKRPLNLAEAHVIIFKTPLYDPATNSYRLLDATITNVGDSVWREFQERPTGNAEYYHVVKAIEPGRIIFARRPNASGAADPTELFVDTAQRILCWRDGPDSATLQCPYALAAIE